MRKSKKVKIFTIVWFLAAFLSLVSWALWNVILIPPFFATLMLVATPFYQWTSVIHAREEREEKASDKTP